MDGRRHMCPWSRFTATLLGFGTVLALAGCAATPGPDGLMRWEHEAVQQQTARLLASPERVQDAALQQRLDTLVCRLDSAACGEVTVVVLARPGLQADLLGARVLRVNEPLLDALQDEDELAFVLAHELAHRQLDHVTLRRRAGWNAQDAEIAADAEAVRRVTDAGFRDTALQVLLRLRTLAQIDDATLDARIAVLAYAAD